MSQSRQLAAIMFTDIVGYTALMGKNEQQAFELLRKNKQIQKPIIEKFNGRWLKEIGDGVLARFSTVTDAVYCALEIQKTCKNDPELNLRIGIHQGEVVFDGDDVFGDGVNIASRLEPLAPAGGILVSESVHNNIINKDDIESIFAGEKQLKNVQQLIRVYLVQVEGSIPTAVAEPGPQSASPVANNFRKISFAAAGVVMILLLSFYLYSHFSTSNALVDAPLEPLDKSIVVLPFTNLSSDPQQEYFSDGMMEEILNHLVKIEELKVISRTTAMQYKQTAKSVREITRELQVATALEGSVRKEGNLVRITVQLIEGETDTHLWSESYDRELTNVFQVQSDVAKQIAAVLRAEISPAAKRSIESRPTSNPEAYNLYLMAEQVGLTNTALAIDLYEQVIQKDPEFASAYAKLGNLKRSLERHNYHPNAAAAVKIAAPYFQKALELDPDNYFAHLGKGQSHLWYEWDFAAANKVYQFLKDKYPNAFILPALLLSTGRFSEALENSRRNIEKDPLDPISHAYYILSLYYAGNYEELLEKIPKSLMLLEGVRTQRNGTFLRLRIAEVYQFLGMYQQSLRMYDEDIDQLDAPEWLAIRAINYHHLGNSDKTGELLEKLKLPAISTLPGGPAFRMASVYAQLQANDEAFDWLDIAYQNHEAEMYWLKVYPSFVPLYGDPRWQHMLDRVGFPESLK